MQLGYSRLFAGLLVVRTTLEEQDLDARSPHRFGSSDGDAGHAAFTWGQIMVQLKHYAETGNQAPVFA